MLGTHWTFKYVHQQEFKTAGDTQSRYFVNSVATLDLWFLATAQAISTYCHLRMTASILPTTPYIFENISTFLPTLRLF